MIVYNIGTGIVPFISVINDLLNEDRNCDKNLHLIFCVKSCDQTLVKDFLYEFCDFWNFRLTIYISLPVPSSFKLYGPNKSFVNEKFDVKKHLEIVENRKYFLCGSKEFMSDIQNYLLDASIKSDLVIRL